MTRRVVTALLIAVAITAAGAVIHARQLDMRGVLVAAKMSGACGILDQQLAFQQTTQMPGGNEFVVRFWRTESARLGQTLEEFSKLCGQSIDLYNKAMTAAEEANRPK